jgi:hypothetical protein
MGRDPAGPERRGEKALPIGDWRTGNAEHAGMLPDPTTGAKAARDRGIGNTVLDRLRAREQPVLRLRELLDRFHLTISPGFRPWM